MVSAELKVLALEVAARIRGAGYIAYLAGGCVRDEILGRIPKDYDIATDAPPDLIEILFERTVPVGKAFGVICVIERGHAFEVATFRADIGVADGRRPESVVFCAPEEDARRRDFTVNGIFYDPVSGEFIDYVGGRADIQKKVIRAIGDPHERFAEDHLRMLRAVRFAHTLEFSMDDATRAAIIDSAGLIGKISVERIEHEFSRILTESVRPGDALQELYEVGLLEHILPEAVPMVGMQQPPQFHPEGDVFTHTKLMLDMMRRGKDYTLREIAWTVLLHDIGKPPTFSIGPGRDGNPRIRFDGHAQKSAEMAAEILTRFRIPNREKKSIVEAIKNHMRFADVPNMRRATLRKMIGAKTFALELELHRVDCESSHRDLSNYDILTDFAEELANEPVLPPPLVNGRDLIAAGVAEGRKIGEWLKIIYDHQIDGTLQTREQALTWFAEQLEGTNDT